MKRIVFTISLVAAQALLSCGCKGNVDKQAPPQENSAATQVDTAVMPVAGQISGELLEIASRSETVMNIQREGILTASLKCDGGPLCRVDEYGAPRGLEVDILRRISEYLGVKLNIVEGPAAIYGAEKPVDQNAITARQPYFYDAKNGWRYFRVSGDEAFAETVSAIIRHLYETETYQQLYKNNFAKEADPE